MKSMIQTYSLLVLFTFTSLMFAKDLNLNKSNVNNSSNVEVKLVNSNSGEEKINSQQISGNRDDVSIIFHEDFEAGMGGWTTIDGTAPTDWNEWWHLSREGSYEGYSWWMGDEALGGYTSHRYIVMDTPVITLPAGSPTLTFNLDYNVEDPAGTSPPYDGWDGSNIRISANGGSTWEVIDGEPVYNCQSLYSFGEEFLEGPGIAGWGGTSNGWVDATFDLSAYAEQNIQIRFAFCSDPAYDTGDDPSLFGIRVDNINVAGIFESNGEGIPGDTLMIPGYGGDASGDFWVLDSSNPHSGSWAMNCPIEPNLMDLLESPEYVLPDLDEIYISYWVYCDMLDSDGDGDNILEDYYKVYAKGTDEPSWTMLHYAYNGNLLTSDWIFIDQDFALANFGWHNGTCDISEYAGDTVQIRFEAITDGNDDGGIGTGLFIDDFSVYTTAFLPPPQTLTADVNENNEVELEWIDPLAGGGEGWIYWDNGNYAGALGLTDPGEWDAASRFTASDLLPYVGSQLTIVKFYPTAQTTEYTVSIWKGTMADSLVAEVYVPNPTIEDWNDVTLPEPIPIEMGDELWIGYHMNQIEPADPNGYSAGYDDGPSVAGLWANLGTGWSDLSGSFDYNWLIRGYVEGSGRGGGTWLNQNRQVQGYNVYHSVTSGGPYDSIGTTTDTFFVHTDPQMGQDNYYVVTALYEEGESPYSNEVSVFLIYPTWNQYYYDDGTAEQGFRMGPGNYMAVKFVPDSAGYLARLIWYQMGDAGAFYLKVFDDDNGVPSAELYSHIITGGDDGWNYYDLGDDQIEIYDTFWFGVKELSTTRPLGVDTDSDSGYSYVSADGGTTWEPIANFGISGNLILRVYLDQALGIDEETTLIPDAFVLHPAYPNPFNPVTNIRFETPSEGNVSVQIYNLAGQVVDQLLNAGMTAGYHMITWDASEFSSGLYFVKVTSGNNVGTQKVLLIK